MQITLASIGGGSDLLYIVIANVSNVFQARLYVLAVLGASAEFNSSVMSSEYSPESGAVGLGVDWVCWLGSISETSGPANEKGSLLIRSYVLQ